VNAANRQIALNTLVAIPVGLVGGTVAGGLLGAGHFIASVISGFTQSNLDLSDSVSGSLDYAVVGAVIGMLSFPIAYAAVARTRNLFVIVPAALVATVVGCWVGATIAGGLVFVIQKFEWGAPWVWISLALTIVFPVGSMFWACAWAAARERRKIANF
jgi:hypothetical protein